MEHDATQDLGIKVPHIFGAEGGFTAGSKCLGEQIVQRFAGAEPFAEDARLVRERVRAQGATQLVEHRRRLTPALRLLHRAAPHLVNQARLERLMCLPQLSSVHVLDRLPQRVAAARRPVGPKVAVVDEAHLRRQPRADVHAVGDVPDRHVLFAQGRIERFPHGPRHMTVQ